MTLGDLFPHLKQDPQFAAFAAMDEAEAFPAPKPPPADLSLPRLVLACPHKRKPPCSCQGFALCGLGKGKDGIVTYEQCLDCKREAT